MSIQPYSRENCREVYSLFYDTVHEINRQQYNKEQLDSWAALNPDLSSWCRPLLDSHTLIYIENEVILGFGNITDDGYLDRLYVHKDHIGKGIGGQIAEELETYAMKLGLREIVTHSSITARSFFEKRGYRLVREQTVERNNQHLTNFIMKKTIYDKK